MTGFNHPSPEKKQVLIGFMLVTNAWSKHYVVVVGIRTCKSLLLHLDRGYVHSITCDLVSNILNCCSLSRHTKNAQLFRDMFRA